MFSIKERATLAANLVGLMAAGAGWEVPSKRLVEEAEEILVEIDLMYKPKAIAEEKRFFEETRRLSSLNPFAI